MSEPTCSTCKFWKRTPELDQFLPERAPFGHCTFKLPPLSVSTVPTSTSGYQTCDLHKPVAALRNVEVER